MLACSCARSSRVCPRCFAAAFICLRSRPPGKGCPERLRACVGVVKPCTRDVSMGMCMNAPLGVGATLVVMAYGAHFHLHYRSTRGRSSVPVVSPRATRAVDGAVLQAHLMSVKRSRVPGILLRLPKARVGNAFTCAATPGPYIRTWLDMLAHSDGLAVGDSNTSCARYGRCYCEHHMTAKGSRHAFCMVTKHACAERSYGRVHEHTTQGRCCSARHDAF